MQPPIRKTTKTHPQKIHLQSALVDNAIFVQGCLQGVQKYPVGWCTRVHRIITRKWTNRPSFSVDTLGERPAHTLHLFGQLTTLCSRPAYGVLLVHSPPQSPFQFCTQGQLRDQLALLFARHESLAHVSSVLESSQAILDLDENSFPSCWRNRRVGRNGSIRWETVGVPRNHGAGRIERVRHLFSWEWRTNT